MRNLGGFCYDFFFSNITYREYQLHMKNQLKEIDPDTRTPLVKILVRYPKKSKNIHKKCPEIYFFGYVQMDVANK